MMTSLLSMFSTFGRFVSLWTTNARLESYSLLSGFVCPTNNYLLENLAFPDDLSYMFLIFIICSNLVFFEMTPVRSVLRFRSYASTLYRFVSSVQESQKLIMICLLRKTYQFNTQKFNIWPFSRGDPFGSICLEWNPPFGCFAFSEDQSRFFF